MKQRFILVIVFPVFAALIQLAAAPASHATNGASQDLGQQRHGRALDQVADNAATDSAGHGLDDERNECFHLMNPRLGLSPDLVPDRRMEPAFQTKVKVYLGLRNRYLSP